MRENRAGGLSPEQQWRRACLSKEERCLHLALKKREEGTGWAWGQDSRQMCLKTDWLIDLCYEFRINAYLTINLFSVTSRRGNCVSSSVVSSCLWPHGLYPTRLLRPWDSPGKNTGVGSHSLLQGIFPTQGLNAGLLHCRQILYCLSHNWLLTTNNLISVSP